MADPYLINCNKTCVVTVVHEFNLPLMNLSLEDGAQISLAIISVWLVGWSIRMLIRVVSDGSHSGDKDTD